MLVVDDSIVRGNTTMMLVDAIRRAGANHVFVASAAPPIRFCNVYGIDMPTRRELIAFQKTEKEVFAFSDREPQPYWLAKAYLLLGDVYVRKGDTFQARATWQSVADGYSPDDDGIVEEARARIAKLN